MRPLPLAIAALILVLLVTRLRRLFPWPLRVAGVVVMAACVVYGAGLVSLPNLEELLLDIGDALGDWTYLLVGALAFLETGAFVGLLAPGETAVIAGGVIAGQGVIEVVPLLLLVWACCVAGDCVSYLLGRKLGRGFLVRHGPRLRITEERIEQVEVFFARRGGVTILIGRFIGLVRALAPFVAGASRMPFPTFAVYDVIGSGLWASTFVLLGYVSWRNIDRAAEIASRGTFILGTIVTIAVATVIAAKTLRTSEQRARARRWLSERMMAGSRQNGAGT
jgi:undecaprenyl-diphosphatase